MFPWLALGAFIVVALAVDLRGGGRQATSTRAALWWSVGWTLAGVAFAPAVGALEGGDAAGEYLTGFLLEKSLSLDNLFVFAVIFSFFAVPTAQRPRILLYGIAGAIVLRGLFIAVGAAALDAFEATTYALGALLAATAVRLAWQRDREPDPGRSRAMALLGRFLPISDTYDGDRLVTERGGSRAATPLLAALTLVAAFDVMFAIDSIPAVFAITRDTFVVFAANAFSLLGMVSLFFVLEGMLARFRYLHVGLAAILGYVAVKLLLADLWHPPVWLSLAVVISSLALAALASALAERVGDRRRARLSAGTAP